jgi:two-component system cell cycle sensor histidine kinase/response regulator CckA
MDILIHDTDDTAAKLQRSDAWADEDPRKGFGTWLSTALIAFLAMIVIGAAVLIAFHVREIGWTGLVFLGGLAVVALFGVMSVLSGQGAKKGQADTALLDEVFMDNLTPSILVKDGRPVRANSAYRSLYNSLGVESQDDEPIPVDRLFSSADEDMASAIFRLHHLESTVTWAKEVLDYLTPDGELRRYKISTRKIGPDATHRLWQVLDVTPTDPIADRLMTHAPVGLFSVSKEGHVLSMNATLEKWLGVEAGARPEKLSEFIEAPKALLESSAVPGRSIRTDTRLITRKGIVTPTILVGRWEALNTGDLICSAALYGHSSLPKAVSPSASRFGAVSGQANTSSLTENQLAGYAAAPVAMLELSLSGLEYPIAEAKIVSTNPAFARMSDDAEANGKAFGDIFAIKEGEHRFLELTSAQFDADKPFDATLTGKRAMPVSVYVLVDTAPPVLDADDNPTVKVWAFLVDVSARKSLEDQLVQSQKMQAIGQLAAGVAHDFNNLLTAIRLNTDELLQRHPVGDPSYPELQNINSTGARAGSLVKKLLAFSRKQTRRMEVLSVTDSLSDMVVTLRQTLGEKAKLEIVHGRNLPPIMADKSQIDSVIMNLCVNARDAMAEQGGGTITVKSTHVVRDAISDDGLRDAVRNLPGNEFVTIEVSDTGTGMPDEIKAKIFEPFFTTKEQGKGTGLGLATVYGIVEQSGGHLDVDSELGVGTTFRIVFPIADPKTIKAQLEASQAANDGAGPSKKEARKPADLAGQGTILFVEDEASVRLIAAKTLRKRGYTVVEAEDGEDALDILEDGEHVFDMMISDVVMPGMDGPTLLEQGRSLLGNARIVFISGYAEEQFSDLLSKEPDVTFLPKPFTLAQLAEKVKAEIGDAK